MRTSSVLSGAGVFFDRKVVLEAIDVRIEKFDLLVLSRFGLAQLSELLGTTYGLGFPAVTAAAHAGELGHGRQSPQESG